MKLAACCPCPGFDVDVDFYCAEHMTAGDRTFSAVRCEGALGAACVCCALGGCALRWAGVLGARWGVLGAGWGVLCDGRLALGVRCQARGSRCVGCGSRRMMRGVRRWTLPLALLLALPIPVTDLSLTLTPIPVVALRR